MRRLRRGDLAACLEPGVSVSRLALEHGVNANLVRKWVKRAREERALPAVSSFVRVQIAPDIYSSSASDRPTKAETIGKRSHAPICGRLPLACHFCLRECPDLLLDKTNNTPRNGTCKTPQLAVV
ncbi:transposase [Pararhizobium sp. PWRC1-1]|uniref:transposase n=1 Tax=Pararhizobium sp. PWRC1-1 TaxID=2804566 RepID=UPI003CE9CEB2